MKLYLLVFFLLILTVCFFLKILCRIFFINYPSHLYIQFIRDDVVYFYRIKMIWTFLINTLSSFLCICFYEICFFNDKTFYERCFDIQKQNYFIHNLYSIYLSYICLSVNLSFYQPVFSMNFLFCVNLILEKARNV